MTKQSGNMLFILLICVALLGALAAIMMRSSSSSDDTGNTEQAIISGADLMKYSAGLETGVSTLLTRGCSENTISFEAAILSGYSNASAPTNKSCHVFDSSGAGLTPKFFTTDPAVSGSYIITGAGTASPDLVYNYTVTKEACEQINNSLGIQNNGPEGPPSDSLTGGAKFTGAYTSLGGAGGMIDNVAFTGKKAGCRHESGAGATAVFIFFQALIAR